MTPRKVILIVDDSEDMLFIVKMMFENHDIDVLTASGGIEALQVLKNNPVDVVLSDIKMPNGDGIFLLDSIRAQNPNTPVVFLMTGFTEVKESECIAKGARQVFLKPFDQDLLVEAVMNAFKST